MTEVLQALIDKQDNFEVVRDQIAVILATERDNQKSLAPTSDIRKLYDYKVYIERSNPWENYTSPTAELIPIVNVWYDRSTFDPSKSNISERQNAVGIFNIDCYGAAVSSANGNGHTPGDEAAALVAQRMLRLVRNILMASSNTYLQLKGLVWQRWPQSATMIQPQADTRPQTHIVAARLTLQVIFNEFSPQYEGEELEIVGIEVKRAETGEILANVEFDYTI